MSSWIVLLLGCQEKEPLEDPEDEPEDGETTDQEPGPEGDCIEQTMGPDGGIIGAAGVRVTIPVDLLDEDQEIALCPASLPSGYTLHSDAWELQASLPGPVEIIVGHDGSSGLALFVPGPDGEPHRSIEQQPAEIEIAGPLYRGGTFFVAEDARVQVEYQETGPADILFVVDNSCSMANDQIRLANTFPAVFDLLQEMGLDYHIGVTSTDIDGNYNGSKGTLHQVDGHRWVDPTTPDPAEVFSDMVRMGESGSGSEKGMGAAFLAFELEGDDTNAGFLRDEAALAIIVVSDEPDLTPNTLITAAEFVDWLTDLGQDKPAVGFHSLIDPSLISAYITVTDAMSGFSADIGGPDWQPFFEDIAGSFGGSFVFDPPAIDVPEVWVDPADGAEPYRLPDEDVDFVLSAQTLEIEADLERGDVIWVLYQG